MVLRFYFSALILLTPFKSFAIENCEQSLLRGYVHARQRRLPESSREFNDAKKLSASINKQLRPLGKEINESYKLGADMRRLEAEFRRISLITPQTSATKNQLHDLNMRHAALTRDLIDRNNRFILKMRELFKKQGIPSDIVTTLDDSDAWRMFAGTNREVAGREVYSLKLSLDAPPTSNEGFNYYRRIQRSFGFQNVTLSLSQPSAMGAGGMFFPQLGRLEVGPMGAINLLREYINVVGKHESRHAMFQGKRARGEASLFHSQFQASPNGNLLNEVNFYEHFMSAEELYTFSTDLQSLAQVFKGDFITDEAKRLSLIAQIREGNQGLTQVAITARDVTASMLQSLERKLTQQGPTADIGLQVRTGGAFDLSFNDDLGRSSKLSFVSDTEKELMTSYQLALKRLSDGSDAYITRKLTEDGVDLGELQRKLSQGTMTAEEQQRIITLNQEFMLLPEATALNQGQLAAYRRILEAAKTRMENLNLLATVQLREAAVLDRLIAGDVNPAQVEAIKRQMFSIGKNVKEDYKGFALNSTE
jgi:hypothetical protein